MLGPKGKGVGMGAPNSPIAEVEPPTERQNLTQAGTGRERGKPVSLPRSDDRPRPVERRESVRKVSRWACEQRKAKEAKASW
jgi:hypothetical protein